MAEHTSEPVDAVLTHYLHGSYSVHPITSGHINRSFRIDTAQGTRFVLQKVSPIFGPEVQTDIAAITTLLAEHGLTTPRLVPTRQGELFTRDEAGGVWRLLTYIEGRTFLAAETPSLCHAAGVLVGHFHRALWQVDYTFAHRRPGVHDTPRHLANLRAALAQHADHAAFGTVAPLAETILARAAHSPDFSPLPLRIVHGDLKISNIVFDPAGAAICLIDLDTLARMPVPIELGDAFRSWCNPQGEEVQAAFELEHFRAGLAGYLSVMADALTEAERAAIPTAIETIALELAARFCADALQESYFGWDRGRFASASAHNLVRTRAQLALAESIRAQMPALDTIVRAGE
jgi:Ser/Thr protein kinase RdoA (MazF antagonist)